MQLVFDWAARGAHLLWDTYVPPHSNPKAEATVQAGQEGNFFSPGVDTRVRLSDMPEKQPCSFTAPLRDGCYYVTLSEFQYAFLGKALILFLQGKKGRRGKKSSIHLFIQQNRC